MTLEKIGYLDTKQIPVFFIVKIPLQKPTRRLSHFIQK